MSSVETQVESMMCDILDDGIDPTDDDDIDEQQFKPVKLAHNKPQLLPKNYGAVHSQSHHMSKIKISPLVSSQYNKNIYKHRNDNYFKQKYQNKKQFHILSTNEINRFIINIWNMHGITTVLPNKLINDFIKRNKLIILKELYCDTCDFQKSIHEYYRKWNNNNIAFNLKIHPTKKGSAIFIVKFTDQYIKYDNTNILNLVNNTKEQVTFVCQCAFTKFYPPNILNIINSDKYMMSVEYLNADAKNKYLVIKIKSLYDIIIDEELRQEYFDHITNCVWLKCDDYPLLLYKWQMTHCKQFIYRCLPERLRQNLMSDSDNNNIKINDEIEEHISLNLSVIQNTFLHNKIVDCINFDQSDSEYTRTQSVYTQTQSVYTRNNIGWIPSNKSQREAIIKSTLSPISLIHGPPGTGKTSTTANLVNFIMELQQFSNLRFVAGGKIFVGAYTHNAANELLSKIVELCPWPKYRDRIVRLGDKDRVPEKLQSYCFEDSDEKEIESRLLKALVVVGTIYSSNNFSLLRYCENMFSYIIIDECTQILHPVLNIAINLLGHQSKEHLILVGDHKQLPPVIKSSDLKKGYKSMFESLLPQNEKDSNIYTLLNIQYRMPQQLISFCNQQFYDGKIESYQKSVNLNDKSTQKIFDLMRKLKQLQNNTRNFKLYNYKNIPIFVISLSKASATQVGRSWRNEKEAIFLCKYIIEPMYKDNNYLSLRQSTGIIALYKEQVKCVRGFVNKLSDTSDKNKMLISTVDAFQGKEKDLIILSMTNNVTDPTPFNRDLKRINVALTRCKKGIIMVCSFQTKNIYKQSIWKKWFDQFHNT